MRARLYTGTAAKPCPSRCSVPSSSSRRTQTARRIASRTVVVRRGSPARLPGLDAAAPGGAAPRSAGFWQSRLRNAWRGGLFRANDAAVEDDDHRPGYPQGRHIERPRPGGCGRGLSTRRGGVAGRPAWGQPPRERGRMDATVRNTMTEWGHPRGCGEHVLHPGTRGGCGAGDRAVRTWMGWLRATTTCSCRTPGRWPRSTPHSPATSRSAASGSSARPQTRATGTATRHMRRRSEHQRLCRGH